MKCEILWMIERQKSTHEKSYFLITAALFTALTAVGSKLSIPFYPVPITLQTFFVLLAGYFLGSKFGSFSQAAYLAIGLIGFPVFARGGGPSYVFQPTFGYLLGYLFAPYITGKIIYGRDTDITFDKAKEVLQKVSNTRVFGAGIAGMICIFVPGVTYLFFVGSYLGVNGSAEMSFLTVIYTGFLLFIPGDIIKLGVILMFLKYFLVRQEVR